MKITEIFDLQNSDNNLILGSNTYFLIHDYEDCRNRLHDHSATLELLTQRALNLSLFKGFPQKLKIAKPSYHTKNEKLKQVQKTKIQGVASGELMVIKKLLLVNLRSFKIMQKLFQENKELQTLLNDSRKFAKKQKQKIEYVQNENESLKKTEIHLKKRLESFFRQLNRASKSFIAGFKNDYNDNDKKISMNNDESEHQSNSQKLELAFNLSTNVAYRLHDDANKFMKINQVCQELSFSYDLDIVLQDLKIRLTPGIVEVPSNNFLNSFEDMYIHRQIRYPLLTWQTEKPFENHNEKSDSKELHPKLHECNYKIEKDIQNAIRLHSVNSSVWKSFLLMKTIREFVIFNQVCELIKAFLIAGEACESDEISSEINQTTLIQLANLNPYSFGSESTSKCTSRSSLSLNEAMFETPNKKAETRKRYQKYTKTCYQKIKNFHSSKKMNEATDETPHEKAETQNIRYQKYTTTCYKKIKVFRSSIRIYKKLIDDASNNEESRTKIPEEQSCYTIRKSISIGVGGSCIVSVDQESQVDNGIFIELSGRNKSNVNLRKRELDEKDSSKKTLNNNRKDFRKSLKSLEDIIKSCQLKSQQEMTTTLKDKFRKKQFNNKGKNADIQRKAGAKMKEVKQKKRSSFDFYNKEYRKISELPEMRKMYQIILENRLSQGLSFEYLAPDQSKVQLLFVKKSRDTNASML